MSRKWAGSPKWMPASPSSCATALVPLRGRPRIRWAVRSIMRPLTPPPPRPFHRRPVRRLGRDRRLEAEVDEPGHLAAVLALHPHGQHVDHAGQEPLVVVGEAGHAAVEVVHARQQGGRELERDGHPAAGRDVPHGLGRGGVGGAAQLQAAGRFQHRAVEDVAAVPVERRVVAEPVPPAGPQDVDHPAVVRGFHPRVEDAGPLRGVAGRALRHQARLDVVAGVEVGRGRAVHGRDGDRCRPGHLAGGGGPHQLGPVGRPVRLGHVQELLVIVDHVPGRAHGDHLPVIEENRPPAQLRHHGGGVADEQHGAPAGPEPLQRPEALPLEQLVAHGQGLVHDQHVAGDADL